METISPPSQRPRKGPVQDGGQQGVEFGGSLGLGALQRVRLGLQRIQFRHDPALLVERGKRKALSAPARSSATNLRCESQNAAGQMDCLIPDPGDGRKPGAVRSGDGVRRGRLRFREETYRETVLPNERMAKVASAWRRVRSPRQWPARIKVLWWGE
jgi:hypothetical protein